MSTMAAAIPIVREMFVKRMNVVLCGWGKTAMFRSVQGRAEDSPGAVRPIALNCSNIPKLRNLAGISVERQRAQPSSPRRRRTPLPTMRSRQSIGFTHHAGSRRRGPSAAKFGAHLCAPPASSLATHHDAVDRDDAVGREAELLSRIELLEADTLLVPPDIALDVGERRLALVRADLRPDEVANPHRQARIHEHRLAGEIARLHRGADHH